MQPEASEPEGESACSPQIDFELSHFDRPVEGLCRMNEVQPPFQGEVMNFARWDDDAANCEVGDCCGVDPYTEVKFRDGYLFDRCVVYFQNNPGARVHGGEAGVQAG